MIVTAGCVLHVPVGLQFVTPDWVSGSILKGKRQAEQSYYPGFFKKVSTICADREAMF
jgi:hypothetical protein